MAWIGECKWWDKSVGRDTIYELERKGQALLRARGGLEHILGYGLFARSFTEDLRRETRSRGDVRLITPQVIALPDHALHERLSSAHNKSTA